MEILMMYDNNGLLIKYGYQLNQSNSIEIDIGLIIPMYENILISVCNF